ncbi:MAG TPA: substrate-binding domain-containing protein [Pirellulales bacterium]
MSSRPRVALMLDLRWPYKRHQAVFAGTQRYAEEAGWETILDEYAADNLPTRRSGPLPYDGIIARANRKLAEKSKRLGIPVVNVWFTSPVWKELPGVFADFVASGRLRAEHLLSRGLRRFAALSRVDRAAKVEVASFRATVEAAGCSCVVAKLPLEPMRTHAVQQESERRINVWMGDWELPIGVFVYGDEMGRMVAQICRRRGLRVPQDVAILTGANEETICKHPRPSLSSVELGHERIGYDAARLLDELMRQPNARSESPLRHVFVPPQGLIVRESTDFMVVDDPLVAAAMTFIATHSHRRLGQEDVARAVHTETRTLQRHFRRVLDRPIAAMIRQARFERAKRELVQTDRSLKEIAHDVGFGEAARMNDVFRRELGVTPSEYREARQIAQKPQPERRSFNPKTSKTP